VPGNVTERVNVPRVAEYLQTALTEEQANRLLEVIAGDRFEALYVLALTTGMREGELLALQWGDVDFEQGVIQVHQTLRESVQEGKKAYVLAEPKSKTSRRRIALTQIALGALRRHRVRLAEERLALGPAWDSSLDLVFPNTIGRLEWPWILATRSFKPLLKRAGLPDIRFHDLRHTAATMLLSRGVPVKVVSEMLGHANISITLQVYGHVLPHMQQAAADVMDTVFRGLSSKLSSNG
jgi:integrase